MLTLCNATQEAGRRMFEALWKRIFGTRAAKAEPQRSAPTEETAYDPVVALRDQLRRDVLGGYFDEDAILTNAHDLFEEELPRPTLRCCGWVLGCRCGVPRVVARRVDGVRVYSRPLARVLHALAACHSVRYLCT